MREQKKEPIPAKGLTLIGNRRTGTTNLLKRLFLNNRQRQILAKLEQTLIIGYRIYERVCRALESIFEGVQYE